MEKTVSGRRTIVSFLCRSWLELHEFRRKVSQRTLRTHRGHRGILSDLCENLCALCVTFLKPKDSSQNKLFLTTLNSESSKTKTMIHYIIGSHPAAYHRTTSFCLLLLRWILGIVLFVGGASKVFGWFDGFGMETTLKFMRDAHFPDILSYLSMFGELIGGGLLVIGLFTRFAAMAMFINMVVAVWSVGLKNFFMGGAAYPFTLLVIATVIALLGAGKYSIDYLLNRSRGEI
jgi:putative oxidoreductase